MSDRTTRSSALNSGLRHHLFKARNSKISTSKPGAKKNIPLSTKNNVKKTLSPKKFQNLVKPVTCQDSEKPQAEISEAGSSFCDRTIYPTSVSSSWDFVGNNILDGLSSSETSSLDSRDFVFEGKDSDIVSVWSLGSYSNDSFTFNSPTPMGENQDYYDINDPHNFLSTEKEIREAEYSLKVNGTSISLSSLTEKMALSSSPASDSSDKVYSLRSHRARKA